MSEACDGPTRISQRMLAKKKNRKSFKLEAEPPAKLQKVQESESTPAKLQKVQESEGTPAKLQKVRESKGTPAKLQQKGQENEGTPTKLKKVQESKENVITVCASHCDSGHSFGHYHCPCCKNPFRIQLIFEKQCKQCNHNEIEKPSNDCVEEPPSIVIADPLPAEQIERTICKTEVSEVPPEEIVIPSDFEFHKVVVSPDFGFRKEHKTFIKEKSRLLQEFSLEKCQGCGYGCKGRKIDVHCPICPPTRFKPTTIKKAFSHLKTHFTGSRGYVRTRGYRVTRCPLPCKFGHTFGHYHCPLCDMQYRNKREFKRHCRNCGVAAEDGGDDCQPMEEASEEFLQDAPSIVLANSKDQRLEAYDKDLSDVVAAFVSLQSSGVSFESNVQTLTTPKTHIKETSDLLEEYDLKICQGCEYGCNGHFTNVHCPICPTSRFKPNRLDKVMSHLKHHFFSSKGHVKTKGKLPPQLKEQNCYKPKRFSWPSIGKPNSMDKENKTRIENVCFSVPSRYRVTRCPMPCKFGHTLGHYHCPFCDSQYRNRREFEKHCRKCSLKSEEEDPPSEKETPEEIILEEQPSIVLADPTGTEHKDHPYQKDPLETPAIVLVDAEAAEPTEHVEYCDQGDFSEPSSIVVVDSTSVEYEEYACEKFLVDEGTSSTFKNRNEVKPCPICSKPLSKRYLAEHIKVKHSGRVRERPKHYSVCIDLQRGIYCVSHSYKGPQHPVHVTYHVSGSEAFVECSVGTCDKPDQAEVNDNLDDVCDHVRSVKFCSTHGICHDMDTSKLLEMTAAGYLSIRRSQKLIKLRDSTVDDNIPLIVEVPRQPNTSERYQWYSVYSGTEASHRWCRFRRVVVTKDSAKKTLSCPCSQKPCLHKSVVRWLLYQLHNNNPEMLSYSKDTEC